MNFYHNVSTLKSDTMQNFNASIIFHIKERLKLNGWTVLTSSNGAAVSSSDNFPNGNINSFPWILLESPAGIITGSTGRVWLTICVSNGGAGSCMSTDFMLHNTLPSGGNIGSPPSSPNQLFASINNYDFSTGLHLFNMAVWGNGAFWVGIATIGSGKLSYFASVLPISDVSNFYPYAIALKAEMNGGRWSESLLDNVKSWNVDGTSTVFRTMLMQGAAGVVGYSLPATGDLGNKHLDSKVYLYNGTAGSQGIVGKIGAEGYDFGLTGCTAVVSSSVDASPPKRCLYGGVWLPANAVMTA